MNVETKHEVLRAFRGDAAACVRCRSHGLTYRHPDGRWARPLFHEEGTCRSGALFVFEAPNFGDTNDPNKGRMTCGPKTDATGRFLYQLLAHVGLTPEDVLLTNSVLCLPSRKGYEVAPSQRNACLSWLGRLILDINPSVVVTCGVKALEAIRLLEPHGLELQFCVGRFYDWYGRKLLPLYHPSPRGRVTRRAQQQFSDIAALIPFLKGTGGLTAD